jgi:hypothetical protein
MNSQEATEDHSYGGECLSQAVVAEEKKNHTHFLLKTFLRIYISVCEMCLNIYVFFAAPYSESAMYLYAYLILIPNLCIHIFLNPVLTVTSS